MKTGTWGTNMVVLQVNPLPVALASLMGTNSLLTCLMKAAEDGTMTWALAT